MGIEQKQKYLATLSDFTCKICPSAQADVIKTYSSFHFFFIPILKFNEVYYVICKSCKSIYKVSKMKGKAFEKGFPLSYWDYQTHKIAAPPHTCKKCSREFNEEFSYCPFCGEKC